MKFFVVYLESKRYFALREKWIQNPKVGEKSTVFFSNDYDSEADFTCAKKYYIDENVNANYDAFVYKSFETYDAAEYYAKNKRLVAPVRYLISGRVNFGPEPTGPVDFIVVSDSDTPL